MEEEKRIYIAIDLKSFYASVECVQRDLNPLTTNLLVADESRTDKTICLAVSPSLKSYGLKGRCRLFEAKQVVKEANRERLKKSRMNEFIGKSYDKKELDKNSMLAIDFICAPPQMAKYIDISSQIYNVYLRYVSKDDIHVYSIDEVFIDATSYLHTYEKTPREFAMLLIKEVLKETGITATAGIGTNMYLAKVAMDIVAKHKEADKDGVRIGALDEMRYRHLLWSHQPLTDFWRVGRGIAKKLEEHGIYTMGDIALCSVGEETDYYNEDLLYKLFGINAELLIDHAWGYEPCTMQDIKEYQPKDTSISSGQVLVKPYKYDKAKIVVREMSDALALDLVNQKLVCSYVGLAIGYDVDTVDTYDFEGEVKVDFYGRSVPKGVNGRLKLKRPTSSSKMITDAILQLYKQIVNPSYYIRRINIVAFELKSEKEVKENPSVLQTNIFTDFEKIEAQLLDENDALEKEKKVQQAMLDIKSKYGKNSILKGMSLEEGATARMRNEQIGGHKS